MPQREEHIRAEEPTVIGPHCVLGTVDERSSSRATEAAGVAPGRTEYFGGGGAVGPNGTAYLTEAPILSLMPQAPPQRLSASEGKAAAAQRKGSKPPPPQQQQQQRQQLEEGKALGDGGRGAAWRGASLAAAGRGGARVASARQLGYTREGAVSKPVGYDEASLANGAAAGLLDAPAAQVGRG